MKKVGILGCPRPPLTRPQPLRLPHPPPCHPKPPLAAPGAAPSRSQAAPGSLLAAPLATQPAPSHPKYIYTKLPINRTAAIMLIMS